MCLTLLTTEQPPRKSRWAWKIVGVIPNERRSIYMSTPFCQPGDWHPPVRPGDEGLTQFEADVKQVTHGYHLFPTLRSAQDALSDLPGSPYGGPKEIWLCEVRPEDFIARGVFKIGYNCQETVASVVYNSFRLVRKVE